MKEKSKRKTKPRLQKSVRLLISHRGLRLNHRRTSTKVSALTWFYLTFSSPSKCIMYRTAASSIILRSTDACTCCRTGTRHEIDAHVDRTTRDWLKTRSPFAEIILCIIENLTCLVSMLICGAGIARNDRSIINQIEESTAMTSEHNLFFSALNCSRKVYIIRLLELLSSLGIWG